jgi:endonuclease/exonuclease/phosphatase family metal-dependent hydrolase
MPALRGVIMRTISSIAAAAIFLVLISIQTGYTQTESNPSIQVMTFNIRNGLMDNDENRWENRFPIIVDILNKYEPEIVGWQEMLDFQRGEILDEIPEYESYGRGRVRADVGEGCFIFYRPTRLEFQEGGTFWLSETPDERGSIGWDATVSRICTWVRFRDLETDKMFYFYNTHFDNEGIVARLESAKLILERIASRAYPYPVILTGDFNSRKGTEPILLLDDSLVDTFEIVHPDDLSGTFHNYTGGVNGEKIDYIYTDSGFDVVDSEIIRDSIDGHYPSDHFPVIAEIVMRP